jgi:NADPH-dependent 2,4-dienoyl-CoA reductase/sulfur reductase-like enzyme
MPRLLVVGGSDAGVSAALQARQVNTAFDVTVLVADEFPNYSICGLPFYLSGEVEDWRTLAHRSLRELEATGAVFCLNHRAVDVDSGKRTVTTLAEGDRSRVFAYDRLVIATGAVPVRPAIAGLEHPEVFVLHTMADSFRLHDYITNHQPESVVIVGAGYIGVELADALTRRGMNVSIVGRSPSVLPTVDESLGRRIDAELAQHGVASTSGVAITEIRAESHGLVVLGSGGFTAKGDIVVVAPGVRPSTELVTSAGIATGMAGAIRVDSHMRTNVPDVYSAGDCAETLHRMVGRNVYLPLGTTAHKQGRVAGENAVGGERAFAGVVGTQVVKVFDIAVARAGFLDAEAVSHGFDPRTVEVRAWDHKAYYPGATELTVRLTGDRRTGCLLGGQIVGDWRAQIAKRIDIVATGLHHGIDVDGLNDLDLSYTPPLGSPWDCIQTAADVWITANEQR